MAWSKESPEVRGYGTAWRKLRDRILARDKYVCQCSNCREADRICIATEVDHIVSKAKWRAKYGSLVGVDDESNLQAINRDCHILKTMLEKGVSPRTGFDANGLPLDAQHPWNLERRASAPKTPPSTPDAPAPHPDRT